MLGLLIVCGSFFLDKKSISFGNVFKEVFPDGSVDFVPREKNFAIPLIPSVWVVKNCSVEKIIVGSKHIEELGSVSSSGYL